MKKYETPYAEIMTFESEDIITDSQAAPTKIKTDLTQSEDKMILGQKGFFGLQ